MRHIQRSQVAVEDFRSEGNQPIEKCIDLPEFLEISRLVRGVDTEDSPGALLALQELQRAFFEVRLERNGFRQSARKADQEFPNAEIRVMKMNIVTATEHLDG